MEIGWTWILLVIGVGMFLYSEAKGVKRRDLFKGLGVFVVAGSVLMLTGILDLDLGTLTVGEEAPAEPLLVPNGVQIPIDNLNAISKTKYDNSYSTVAGRIEFYAMGSDPTSPTANFIDNVTLASGVGSQSTGRIKTDTIYRIVFDGSTTYYGKDFGEVVAILSSQYNQNTGYATFDAGEMVTVGAFSNMSTNNINTSINGQTSWVTGTDELGVTDASNLITYDISAGDASFYVDMDLECSGANRECQNAVLCFDYESGAEPEGNEYSSISTQLRDGADLGIPAEIVEHFKDEACISLGNMKSGTSSTYRFTFSATESNMDANDDFKIILDDLGDVNGKDIAQNKGADKVFEDFDHQA